MPPAGWYPDPASSDNIRYWDGQRWTDRSQPKSAPPPPPAPPAIASQPTGSPAYPATPGPGAQTPVAPGPGEQAPTPQAPTPMTPAPMAQAPIVPQPPGPPQAGGYGPQVNDPYGGYGYAPAVPMGQPPGRIGPDGQILSGWWRRVGGYLIDIIIVLIPALIAAAITASVIGANGGTIIDEAALDRLVELAESGASISTTDVFDVFGSGLWTLMLVSGAVYLIASLINGVYLVSRSGQTLGDRAVSIRKVMAGRTVPTFGVALARWLIPNALFGLLANIVPFGFLLTYINYLWPLWDAKSRTLHDMMVKTYVERSDLTGPPVSRG